MEIILSDYLMYARVTSAREVNPTSPELQRLIPPEQRSQGDQLQLQLKTNFQIRPTFGFQPIVEWRGIAENQAGTRDANIYGIGAGVTKRIGWRCRFDASMKHLCGSMNNGDMDLSGWAFTGSLRTGF